eukprot:scaffold104758_cov32-Tisochrysis_lutea.AAC.1
MAACRRCACASRSGLKEAPPSGILTLAMPSCLPVDSGVKDERGTNLLRATGRRLDGTSASSPTTSLTAVIVASSGSSGASPHTSFSSPSIVRGSWPAGPGAGSRGASLSALLLLLLLMVGAGAAFLRTTASCLGLARCLGGMTGSICALPAITRSTQSAGCASRRSLLLFGWSGACARASMEKS